MKKCPFCDRDIADIDAMTARSDYEAELNRIAQGIQYDLGVDAITACELAKKRIAQRDRIMSGSIPMGKYGASIEGLKK